MAAAMIHVVDEESIRHSLLRQERLCHREAADLGPLDDTITDSGAEVITVQRLWLKEFVRTMSVGHDPRQPPRPPDEWGAGHSRTPRATRRR